MNVPAAIHARLIADTTLIALLATYRSKPAVLVGDHAVGDVLAPYILIDGPESDVPDDCKVEDGRDLTIPVRCYTAATGSTLVVTNIAERVRELLHRHPAGLAPGAYIAECTGPRVAPSDPTIYGREVLLRLVTRT